MRTKFGETRSVIHKKHALMSPDSYELTPAPSWPGSDVMFVITPDMGAQFTEYIVTMPKGAIGKNPLPGAERFFMVLDGEVRLQMDDGDTHSLTPECYALVPAETEHEIEASAASRLVVLERFYEPLDDLDLPELVVGKVSDRPKERMTDDGLLEVQKLIPADVKFDCAVNVMEFKPGGSLPRVETHYVEHGLLMLNGGGVYRLDDDWYPVCAGDVIWMGPYCEQWFGAIGTESARYLIYKNWNRDPLIGAM